MGMAPRGVCCCTTLPFMSLVPDLSKGYMGLKLGGGSS